MKLRCKFCKSERDFATFDEVQEANSVQCWVTIRGTNHHFNEVVF